MRSWHKSCTFSPSRLALAAGGLLACAVAAGAAEVVDLARLPDPTRPQLGVFARAADDVGGPVLSATRISPTARRAVIGGRSVGVGDKVNGAVVADIQPFEVLLREGKKETRLRLLPKLVKEPKAPSGKVPGTDG